MESLKDHLAGDETTGVALGPPEIRPMKIEVRLPIAPADDYLRWVAYWRDVETAMLENPGLDHAASSESAPFIQGDVARGLSAIIQEIREQARVARSEGTWFAPVAEIEVEHLRRMAEYVTRRGAWLQEHANELPFAPLDPDLYPLRQRVVAAFAGACGGRKL